MGRTAMTPDAPMSRNHVVGRVDELSRIDAFLDGLVEGPAALVLEGGSGMGKTTLWDRGVAAAVGRGWRVLSIRPAESEATLAFAGSGRPVGGHARPLRTASGSTARRPRGRPPPRRARRASARPSSGVRGGADGLPRGRVAGSGAHRARRRPMARPLDDGGAGVRAPATRRMSRSAGCSPSAARRRRSRSVSAARCRRSVSDVSRSSRCRSTSSRSWCARAWARASRRRS